MNDTSITKPVDADIAALAGAARNLVTDETPLKFVKGRWKTYADKDDPEAVGDTETFVVDMLSYACGWVKWENKRPVQKFIYRPVDGWILPTRDHLPDRDKSKWPLDKDGKRSNSWQENHKITMKNTTTGELFTWTATSWYGRKAFGRLLDSYVRDAKKHPGMMPMVVLSSKDEHSPDYGDIPAPVLSIVNWEKFGDGAAPPGSPMPQPTISTKQLALPVANEIIVEETDAEEIDDDFGKHEAKSSGGRGFDDDIPFAPCI